MELGSVTSSFFREPLRGRRAIQGRLGTIPAVVTSIHRGPVRGTCPGLGLARGRAGPNSGVLRGVFSLCCQDGQTDPGTWSSPTWRRGVCG